MKILYDHQIFSYQKYGGVSKYFCELLAHIPREEWDTTVVFSNNEYINEKKLIKVRHIFPNKWFRGQGRLMNELNKPYSAWKIRKGEFDVFHQTHFETYCLPYLKDKPMVTTFHDMNFDTYNKNEYLVKIQKESVARANKIIAVSHNTKKDLVEMWNINPQKIEVIHHGVDAPLSDALIGNRIVEQPYILYVGRREGFKNFSRLVTAFSILKKNNDTIKLVCTSEPLTKEEVDFLKTNNLYDDVIHISANEKALANLYKHAELFVYPSIYEGFGMPILEAMSYGCATAISNTSCFPEVAGEAAAYFDPHNEEDMAATILKLLEDNELKKSYICKGYERIKLFTWENTAKKHIDVYKSLI
ncbi:glycosyltransferase family 1 protein [Paludibacter sp. 221]|uniref:glycosyltransferase family 4 protein n=1 Tax=Paludibacter sp. 221 TaxID=2302939 RepID=UPI0013D61530|nr:glycosyltransferase family 1 protein [Paludibacter sp. 221]NDV47424.1 glycosyltransferase family 1 protein [Paludibacter sp. 221]